MKVTLRSCPLRTAGMSKSLHSYREMLKFKFSNSDHLRTSLGGGGRDATPHSDGRRELSRQVSRRRGELVRRAALELPTSADSVVAPFSE